ncbi:MAG: hypothetical protein SH857_18585 [Chitinophagales bacterium]|nr:hypothetical protein [Chitinophagales bacterium]
MLTKQKVRDSLRKLPENFTIDDLIDHLLFTQKVEEGLAQSHAGKVHTKEQAKKKLGKWLK